MTPAMTRTTPRLPAIAPGRAVLQSALVAALRSRGLPTRPGAERAAEASGWVVCAGGIAVAPLVAGDRRLGLLADDGTPDAVCAVAALAAVEPLLGRIEAAIGTELLPIELSALPAVANDGIVLAIDTAEARLLLALPDGAALSPRPASAPAAATTAAIAARWQLVWHCPRPRRTPARGDLLLGLGEAAIRLGNWQAPARLANDSIRFIGGWTMALDDASPAGLDPAGLELAVTVRIDGTPMPVAELARLGPGAVLPLPGAGTPGHIAVTVLAGGVALGSGTLVAVGDGHGVLFDRIFAVGLAG